MTTSTAKATTSLFGAGRLVASGTKVGGSMISDIDGFAIGQIFPPGNNSLSSFAFASINSSGIWFRVLGGTVGSFGSSWTDTMDINPNCLTIPVQAGTRWYFDGGNTSGTQADSIISFFWFPAGGGSRDESSSIASLEESPKMPPPPKFDLHHIRKDKMEMANTFITKLENAFGKKLDDTVKKDLVGSLLHV